MRAIDTNVLARLIMQDEPAQTAIAERAVAGGVRVAANVLLEFAWLLQSRYALQRPQVAMILRVIVDAEDLHVTDPTGAIWAIDRYAEGADIADMFHLVASADEDAFMTFDRHIAHHAGPTSPLSIETL